MTNPYTAGLHIVNAGEETVEQRERRERLEETDRKLRAMAAGLGPPGGGFDPGLGRRPYTPSLVSAHSGSSSRLKPAAPPRRG